jgi:hypothetical protein
MSWPVAPAFGCAMALQNSWENGARMVAAGQPGRGVQMSKALPHILMVIITLYLMYEYLR